MNSTNTNQLGGIMKYFRVLSLSVFLFFFTATLTYGQDVLRLNPFDGTADSYLMAQISADTTATGGLLPSRVYELEGGGLYLNTEIFNVQVGETLRLVSSSDVKPIIYQYPTGTGTSPQNPPGYFVRLRGGSIEMTGIALSGFFEPIDSNFNNVQGNMIRVDNEGSSIILDDCLFTNINGQIIRTEAATTLIKVTNCTFANLGSLGNSNLGAGKGIDLRASSCASLILVNNTFVNYQDRVVRHYNFSNPLEGTGEIESTLIDHNTFVNGMGFHGLLSLGNLGSSCTITNNMFYDAFALGEDSTDATRAFEWGNTGEFYPNGNNRITWIFSAPNDVTNWTVSNNFYAISAEGQSFLDDFGFPEGEKLSWHINSKLGADSATAFTKVDVALTEIPALMTNMMRWYESPEGGNKTKNTPTELWVREEHDMDRKPYSYFVNDMDISYGTASAAYTGATMGYPAGNLNAYPSLLPSWEQGIDLNQEVVQLRPFDGTADSYLMAQISADTTATGGLLPSRVYELEGGGLYLNTEIFNVQVGETLRLVSSSDVKPIIYQYPTGTGTSPQNPPGYFVRLRGGSIEMTGIALSGFFEPIDSNFNNVQGNMIRVDNEGSSIILDDCLFTNINGQIIRTEAATTLIKVTNCTFANLGSLGNSNLGAGKGIDLRASSCASLILVNNTFVNYQDRVVRHYNFSNPLEGTGEIESTLIDHNTFVNGMGFHGLLSLGNLGSSCTITNNMFYDAFALGEDSTDATRAFEWGNTGEFYPNGNNRITWIFSAPNDVTNWTVSNNFYAISAEGQSFLDDFGFPEGEKLSWHINSKLGADSATAFTKVDVTLTEIPALMTNMMRWYESPEGGNKTKNTPTELWVREEHDMDRKPYSYFVNDMDISYGTASAAYTGATMGYPAGNLNAYPSLLPSWEQGIPLATEQENGIVTDYKLLQNYPNPFNPTTKISYSVPEHSVVSLIVYNSIGQEIARLVNNQEVAAGQYDITWNGKDMNGHIAASGVYFYQLVSKNVVKTMKMMLLK